MYKTQQGATNGVQTKAGLRGPRKMLRQGIELDYVSISVGGMQTIHISCLFRTFFKETLLSRYYYKRCLDSTLCDQSFVSIIALT